MAALTTLARAHLSVHWRGWAALGLLVGLVSGAVLAAAAGARRTDSAYPRFLRAVRTFDAYIYLTQRSGAQKGVDPNQVLAEPQVGDAALLEGFAITEQDVAPLANLDGHLGSTIDRYKVLAGRPPLPDRPDEALVGFVTAQRRHLHVGSSLLLHFVPTQPEGTSGTPIAVTFRVVGVEAGPGEFPPQQASSFLPVVLTPAFLHTPLAQASQIQNALIVRLRHGGADVVPLSKAVQRSGQNVPIQVIPLAPNSAVVQRSFHLQAVALWLVAGVAALVGCVIVVQLLARQLGLSSSDYPVLRALGATTAQLWALGLAGAGVAAAVGTVSGALIALALSPLTPLGVARVAEPRPGVAFDGLVLGLGVAGTLLAVVGLAWLPAWVAAGRAGGPAAETAAGSRPASALASALGRMGLPPTLSSGTRLALDPGRGAVSVPVRSGIGAVAVGVGVLTAALTFVASSTYLLGTPSLYGVTFDAEVRGDTSRGMAAAVPAVRSDPAVRDAAVVLIQVPLVVNGVDTEGESIAPLEGAVWPRLLEGRTPERLDEVVLGTDTLRAAHARVGDDVALAVRNVTPEPRLVRVVGRAVMPTFSDREQLGRGVAMSADEVGQLVPAAIRPHVPRPDHLLVRFAPGINVSRARAGLAQAVSAAGAYTVSVPDQPTDLVNFGGVRALPLVLAGLMAGLAAATLAYLLASAVRRRRRDLVILKSLGFAPHQVEAVIRWQATTLAVVGLGIGLPLGSAAGRWAWTLVSGDLGVIAAPRVPAAGLAIASFAAIVVAIGLSLVPAAGAARLPVAATLREE